MLPLDRRLRAPSAHLDDYDGRRIGVGDDVIDARLALDVVIVLAVALLALALGAATLRRQTPEPQQVPHRVRDDEVFARGDGPRR